MTGVAQLADPVVAPARDGGVLEQGDACRLPTASATAFGPGMCSMTPPVTSSPSGSPAPIDDGDGRGVGVAGAGVGDAGAVLGVGEMGAGAVAAAEAGGEANGEPAADVGGLGDVKIAPVATANVVIAAMTAITPAPATALGRLTRDRSGVLDIALGTPIGPARDGRAAARGSHLR